MNAARGRTAVSRADLVRLLGALPREQAKASAELVGFYATEPKPAPVIAEDAAQPPSPERRPEPQGDYPKMPFWRLETMTFHDEESDEASAKVAVKPAIDFDESTLLSPDRSIFATPKAPPLTPWSRLWPTLKDRLQTTVPGRDPDVGALLRAWGRGEVPKRIPRVARKAWAGRVSVWVDRSARLVPCWSDQLDVRDKLRKVCGKSSLDVRYLEGPWATERGGWPKGFRPDASVPVVALSDLGYLGGDVDREVWRRAAKKLTFAEVRPMALVPCPKARWVGGGDGGWIREGWERGALNKGDDARREPEVWEERARRLLRLIAPASLVQVGLLRALRQLLPSWEVDVSTEVDVLRLADVRADVTGLMIEPSAAAKLREAFARDEAPELQAKVNATIRQWHEPLPRELTRVETLAWMAVDPEGKVEAPGDREDALKFATYCEAMMMRAGDDPSVTEMLARYFRRVLPALPEEAYQVVPALQVVWARAFRNVEKAPVPKGVDAVALAKRLDDEPDAPGWWAVRHVGSKLVFSRSPSSAWPSHDTGPGSPVAWLLAARRAVIVREEGVLGEMRYVLAEGLELPASAERTITMRTDQCEIGLSVWRREAWAVAAGRDRFGLWADAEIKGVAVRFRWIPPGRFWMGSPDSEVGRYENEGPRHRVVWTQGRWFGDTPVTQELWERVMNENPSRFKSPKRPVEGVSWEDCKKFTHKLNKINSEFYAMFPTEAEWEHACRAGTETATWLGDLKIEGENNAPLLDAIAWYGGNSGHEFDLKNGSDSSKWPNKQYPHTRTGTREVGGRLPNPFGLYDMLGNVWEWCEDKLPRWDTPYDSNVDVNNPPASSMGSYRVFRGGSWDSSARLVRAADRYANDPGIRIDILGFRLARPSPPAPSPARGRGGERDDIPPTPPLPFTGEGVGG